ncbi:hypothetical protein WOLCODRAFT_155818 [Wolfiporia cocos MD-104 SS10]|uniref:Uncharacterized protein n=1 Tax=Wolfiporia cocos (strain MD-104) TaxID=742152 RepID=A0A2H3IYS0_WOLCO|nr:hypothetical protein WOLCODRAFT_155818 [Wolfiporia cocos MD-104 SS10]
MSPPEVIRPPGLIDFELVQELTSIFDKYQDITEHIVQLEWTALYQRWRLGWNLEQWIDHLGTSTPLRIWREFQEVEAGPQRPPRQRSPPPPMPSWLLEDDELARITELYDFMEYRSLVSNDAPHATSSAANNAQFERGRAILGLPPCLPLPQLTTRLVDDLHQLRSSAERSGSGATQAGTIPSTVYPDGSESAYGSSTTTSGTSPATTSTMFPQPNHHLDLQNPIPVKGAAAPITGSSTAPTTTAPRVGYPSLDTARENACPTSSGSLCPHLLSPMEMQDEEEYKETMLPEHQFIKAVSMENL